MNIEILKNKVCKAYYNEDLKLCKVVWNATPSHDEFKETYSYLVAFCKTHRFHNFLSDITNQGINSTENRKWFETEIIPAAAQLGVKKVAIVTNLNLLKKLYIHVLSLALKKTGLPVKVFYNENTAIEWLKNSQ